MEFTLENLVTVLQNGGYIVTASGPDTVPAYAELRKMEAWADKLPPPFFYAIIEKPGKVLEVSANVMELVWSKFERGLMEFRGDIIEGGVRVTITQKEKGT